MQVDTHTSCQIAAGHSCLSLSWVCCERVHIPIDP